MSKSSIVAIALVLVMVASAFTVATMNVVADKGVRDSYGYAWTDSKSPVPTVAFNWVEIKPTGTLSGVLGDSGSGGPFPIGFDFSFYGARYSAFNISSNGYIQFAGMSSVDYPDSIPDWWTPNNIIALYWDDMDVDAAPEHGIYYQTMGVAPDRQLVIEFVNITDYWSSSHMMMEIILKENGQIWMQYQTLNGFTGDGAAVGIENADGSIGCPYGYYYSSRLEDNLAIRFWDSPVVLGPPDAQAGHPGSELSYMLTVTNDLGIADTIELEASGVEGWAVQLYDSWMNPLIDTDSDGLVDTGLLSAGSSFTFYANVTVPLTPSNATEYTVINASAHSNPLLYDECVLSSDQTAAWFDPPHLSFATDTDSNGDFNTLTLNVSIYVRVAGWYNIDGDMYTESSMYVWARSDYSYHAAGSQTVQLVWNGWHIRDANEDGQLRIDLEMRDGSWIILDTDTHTTAYYFATDFMVRPAVLNPPHYDTRIDTDSDGLYETLMLHANVTVIYDGLFSVSAYLYDSAGDWMDMYNYTQVTLTAGDHTVDLGFDSREIRKNTWRDGPFRLSITLEAYAGGIWETVDSGNHYTQAYDIGLFEALPAYFQGTPDDSVLDTNSDGLYDWLFIDVGVNVTVADEYTITGDLSRVWFIDTETNHTYLDVGFHTVRLAFPGYPIRLNGWTGWYDVDLTLTGASGELDTDYYTTGLYWYDDFADIPARFTGVYDHSVSDIDSDGLYDFLLVNVTVNVTVDGTYEVYALLENWWGGDMCEDTNRTFLTADEYVFHFAFPGWVIREYGDDPDEVTLYLYDEDGRQLDSQWVDVSSYWYMDFETLPATFGTTGNTLNPHDDDSDGTNDTMVMEVNVTVDSEGYYYVQGLLEDNWGTEVGEQRVLVWLPVGNNTVTIEFPGWLIHALAVNGTYWCYADLYDSDMNQADSMSYSGGYWYNDFDPTVPRITSSWATGTPTIDGFIASGEWADATVIDMRAADSMNMVGANLLVMNNATHLFIGFDVYGDTSEDTGDSSSFAFDTGNDDIATDGAEDEFELWASGSENHYDYYEWWSSWRSDCSPFDVSHPDHAGLMGDFGYDTSPGYAYDHRIFEYSVPLALLGATMGDTLGFITRTHNILGLEDGNNGSMSSWPLMVSWFQMDTYGELVLASHVTIPPPVTTCAMAGTMGTNNWYTTGVRMTLSATGGDGGVDHTEYSLDGAAWLTYTAPIMVLTNGTHSIRYRSVDAASQVETTKTMTFKIDGIKPATVAGKSGSWVWLNATDAHSAVSVVKYRIDGGSWVTYTGAFNVTGSKGSHTVEFYATDNAGNTEAIGSITVEVTEGTGGGISGLLSNPLLWILLIAAIAAVLVVVFLVMKRRKGQQPVVYPGPGQPMPLQPTPDMPPPPGPNNMG